MKNAGWGSGLDDREYAAMLLAEQRKREEAYRNRPNIRRILFRQQQEAAECDRSVFALLCGRRAGKSVFDVAWLVDGALERPGTLNIYITLTARNARLIAWPTLKWLAREFKIPGKFNESELSFTLDNGSKVLLGGCKDRSEVEKYRGPAYYRVVVDECGAFPPYIEQLYRDVIRPATIDHRGQIAFTGTPGIAWHGFWFDMTGPDRKGIVPVFEWNMFDNPHLPHAREDAEAIRDEQGWTEESPSWVREYLGRWVQDLEALMFPFEPELNGADTLPEVYDTRAWRYVLGVDVGQVDETAYVVWATHPELEADYIVESSKASGLLTEQVAYDVRKYQQRYPGAAIAMDTGGMGKQHEVELKRRFGLPVEAADKREKESAIRILRDRLKGGKVKVLDGPRNDAIRDEWAVCRWDEQFHDFAPDQVDHAAHAALYGYRRARAYLFDPHKEKPVERSPEWFDAEEARIFEARVKKLEQQWEDETDWHLPTPREPGL